jgi:4-hydroxythreonine-4-phosphate dehydrogenase
MPAAQKPLVGITMGDPAGIGPEIIAKAWTHPEVHAWCRPLVIGDARIFRRALTACRLRLDLCVLRHPSQADPEPRRLDVLDVPTIAPGQAAPGRLSRACGRAAVRTVLAAIDHAMANRLDAVVTAPLNKEAMRLARYRYDGHTEIFGRRTRAGRVAMLLVVGRMRVIHVSAHTALRVAIRKVSQRRVLGTIRLAHLALRQFGVRAPRVAVAGLNPHAGERGLFGREEIREIIPAISAARQEGINALGPFPPDSLFYRARRGEFDCVVAMYHDQGHIPMKLLGFDRGVNVTVGLPIVRTSVDHGTAFDIAGKGIASERSLVEAIRVAARLARHRRAHPDHFCVRSP